MKIKGPNAANMSSAERESYAIFEKVLFVSFFHDSS